MDWYYAKEGQQIGPVSEGDFQQLVAQGVVAPGTLVWHEGMENWRPYGAVAGAGEAQPGGAGQYQCIMCNRFLPHDQVLQFPEGIVCGECKPTYLQCIREGVPLETTMVYAGFWIRFLAVFVDGIVTGVIGMIVGGIFGFIIGALSQNAPEGLLIVLNMMLSFVGFLIGLVYEVWFIGKFGATPGKMACGLKVLRSDGSEITYLRSFARYWAKMLSSLTLLIGYIMAAFDSEKRALHDHICDTRVVRIR